MDQPFYPGGISALKIKLQARMLLFLCT